MQFLMMMIKYFTFYLCSRIAHIWLLLKFLFKILIVLRITSNLNVVKAIWLHFLSGQLHLFYSTNFTFLWIIEFSGGSDFIFLCTCKSIHMCSLWKMMIWHLIFLYNAWLLFFNFPLKFCFRECIFKCSSHLRYVQLCLYVAAWMVICLCHQSR